MYFQVVFTLIKSNFTAKMRFDVKCESSLTPTVPVEFHLQVQTLINIVSFCGGACFLPPSPHTRRPFSTKRQLKGETCVSSAGKYNFGDVIRRRCNKWDLRQ